MRILSAADRTPQVAAPRRFLPGTAGRPLLRVAYVGLLLAALAGLAAAAIFIGSRLEQGLLTSQLPPSPSPIVVVSPSPSSSAAVSSAPTGTPTPSASAEASSSLAASPPPAAAWSTLSIAKLASGPTEVLAFTQWAGGYFAVGAPTPDDHVTAWVSADGRAWTALPQDVLPPTLGVAAAPFGDGLLVVLDAGSGNTVVVSSTDGTTWTAPVTTSPTVASQGIASGAAGLVGLPTRDGGGLLFKPAGSDPSAPWEPVRLPNQAHVAVAAVARFQDGFVAVGSESPGRGGASESPVAFVSQDGRTWTAGTVGTKEAGGLRTLTSGANGLAAWSSTPLDLVPGTSRFWTSADGGTWTRGVKDPLGVIASGEGVGSANGLLTGDGDHILVYGDSEAGGYELWLSTDASSWTRLQLSGDTSGAVDQQADPHLLRDGILFDTTDGTWVGTAAGS
jgi:hypothetical protein